MHMRDNEDDFVPDYEEDADGGAAAHGAGNPASSDVLLPAAAEEGTKTTSSGALQPAAAESTEDRRGVKRESQEQQEEKRVARDRVAYNAAPPGRGPRNALTYTGTQDVADAILENMRRWYEERLDGEDVSVGWKHLQQCLFKTVTVPLSADMWRNPNLGAAQPEDES